MSIQKYKKKNGFGYKAIVQLPTRKQVSKRFNRKIDAEKWEIEMTVAKSSGGITELTHASMTVSELGDYWFKQYSSQEKAASSSIRDACFIRNQFNPHFGHRRIADLTVLEIENWRNHLRYKDHLAPKTCNSALGLLKKMLTDAVRWRFLKHNIISSIRPFKLQQQDFSFLNKDEARVFLDHCRTKHPGYYQIYALALYSGMRKGELRGLKWDSIDFKMRKITVKRSYCEKSMSLKESTKSNKIRHIPMNGPVFELLVGIKAQSKSNFVLASPFNWSKAPYITAKIAKAALLPEICFHDLRHSFASTFMMSGGNIYDLQKLLGHATTTMTERYSHLSPEHLMGKTDILNFETLQPKGVTN